MADRLLLYEALENALNAAETASNYATQKGDYANQKANTAQVSADTANAASNTALSSAQAANVARDSAYTARDGANTAAANASAQAQYATQQGQYATTQGQYAKAQGDYAKQMADIAKNASATVGDMSKAIYDVNNTGVVDNAEALGGVAPAGYVRAGTEPWRIQAQDKRSVQPSDLSTATGHARFRLGSLLEDSNAPLTDVLDLSTASSSAAGGVNSLSFRKDQSRIYHRYGAWNGAAWTSSRSLAYLDEVLTNTGNPSLSGNLSVSGLVTWGVNGFRIADKPDFAAPDISGFYQGNKAATTPTSADWHHLIQTRHTNSAINQTLQISSAFGGTTLYWRSVAAADLNASSAAAANFPWRAVWDNLNFDPTTKLNVANPAASGTLTVSQDIIWSSTGARLHSGSNVGITTSGSRSISLLSDINRVGIGTQSPAYALDVSGSARASDLLTTSGGIRSDNVITFTNTALGTQKVVAASLQVGSGFSLTDPGVGGIYGSGNAIFDGSVSSGLIGTIGPRNNPNAAAVGLARLSWSALGASKNFFPDVAFRNSVNGLSVYNTTSGGSVTLTRVTDASAPNSTQNVMVISNNGGAASPGLGGFVQSTPARRNGTFVQSFVAKIPTGYTLAFSSNAIGNEGTIFWLTPAAGTGAWEEYAVMIRCGNAGTFQDFGYIYLTGPAGAVEWRVAEAAVYDVRTPALVDLLTAGGTFAGTARFTSDVFLTKGTAAWAQTLNGLQADGLTAGPLQVNAAGQATLLNPSSGNVGIGTTTPAVKLDVIGEARATTVTAMTTLNLPSGAGIALVTAGTGDNATYQTYNVAAKVWYGLAFRSFDDSVNAVLNVRTGTWRLKGGVQLGPDDSTLLGLSRDSSGALLVSNGNGYVAVGPRDNLNTHFYTDRAGFVFNQGVSLLNNGSFVTGSSYLSPSAGAIAGQAIVMTNDARLKSWGNWSTNGANDLLGNGKNVMTADGSVITVNNGGANTGGIVLSGPGVTVPGMLSVAGSTNLLTTYLLGGNDLQLRAAANSNDAGDLVFASSTGAEFGRVHAGVADGLHLQVKGTELLTLTQTINTSRVPLQTTSPSGVVDSNLHNRAGVQVVTVDGSVPVIAWRRNATDAVAVYKTNDNRLRVIDQSGNDALLLSTLDVDPTQVTGNRTTIIATGGNANAALSSGVYAGPNLVGAPIASNWFYYWHAAHASPDFAGQLALDYFGDNLYLRRKAANTWQPWQRVWHTGDFNPSSFLTLDGSRAMTGTLTLNNPNFPLILGGNGARNWVFLRPNDATSSLILAPSGTVGKQDWDWSKQFTFGQDGSFTAGQINAAGLVMTATTVEQRVFFANCSDGAAAYLYANSAAGGTLGIYDTVGNSVWRYDRNSNNFSIDKPVVVNANGIIGGALNVTGTLSQNGAQVWHAGNFDPGVLLALDGSRAMTGTLTLNNPNFPLILGGNGARNWVFLRPNDATSSLILAPSGTAGKQDWDWSKQFTFGQDGSLSAGQINTRGSIVLNTTASEQQVRFINRSDAAMTYFYANGSSGGILGLTDSANGSVWRYDRNSNNFSIDKPMVVNANSTVNGGLNVTGALSQNGAQVWHTSNFDPNGKLNIAGGTVNGALNVTGGLSQNGAQVWTTGNFDPNGKLNITGGTVNGGLNVTGALSQNGAQVWHAGNFDPNGKLNTSGGSVNGTLTLTSGPVPFIFAGNGSRNWIFHRPGDTTNNLVLTSASTTGQQDWNWLNQFTFGQDGSFSAGQINTRGSIFLDATGSERQVVFTNRSDNARIYLFSNPSNGGMMGVYDTANGLVWQFDRNGGAFGLYKPTVINAALSVTNGLAIVNGSNLVLSAPSSSSSDAGDIVFTKSDGSEIARLYAAADATSAAWRFVSGSTTTQLTLSATGLMSSVGVTAPAYYTSSLRALKQGIRPYVDDALKALSELNIVRYAYRDAPTVNRVGIIADDTPNADISGERHDRFDLQNTVAILVAAVQQLQREVSELRGQGTQ